MVFAAVNRQLVEISLFPFPYSAEAPLFLLVIFCFLAGTIIASVVFIARASRIRHLYNVERKKVMALENELEGTKAQPDATGIAHY
ncbi:MAG: lipopolysaccharide assembly protein LapA domain-containing protein [Rickettsiales bacterium]